jgi:hypothetical protein
MTIASIANIIRGWADNRFKNHACVYPFNFTFCGMISIKDTAFTVGCQYGGRPEIIEISGTTLSSLALSGSSFQQVVACFDFGAAVFSSNIENSHLCGFILRVQFVIQLSKKSKTNINTLYFRHHVSPLYYFVLEQDIEQHIITKYVFNCRRKMFELI